MRRLACFSVSIFALSLAYAGDGFATSDDDQPAASPVSTDTPCEQLPYSILVTVKNVKSDKGIITLDLHGDDPDRWLKKGGRVGRVRVPAQPPETKICVPVEKPGTYAFALYHDKDHNLKLNKTWIGLPDEPYGVSNDAPIRLGPPSFKDASFQVTGPLTPETVNLSN
ncbi:MAG: DUF2141 domain-containing protein [Rhodospirillaceae bacterium]|nr:DUF2141 domain-containing protein [Rhodospirillaceae bacterium]